MAQYEYLQVSTKFAPGSLELGEFLNKYGQEGWELITVEKFNSTQIKAWILIFLKRKLPPIR